MNNYIELYDGRPLDVCSSTSSTTKSKTINPPARLKAASQANDRTKIWLLISTTQRSNYEAWIQIASSSGGGYIKYADAYYNDEGSLELTNIRARIIQREDTLQEYGYSTVTTKSEQTYSNSTDDALVAIEEDYIAGTLQANSGYSLSVDSLKEMTYNSSSWSDGVDAASKYFQIRSVLGILGLPYQFMPHVDVRYDPTSNTLSNNIDNTGVDYAERIIANMPLLLLTPGKPNFMSGYNTEEKKSALTTMLQSVTGRNSVNIDDLVSSTGKFYTFEPTAPEYFTYLNPIAHLCARLMEVETCTLDGKTLDSIDWLAYTQNQVSNIVDIATDYMAVPIYLDSETQISENFSNDTTESSFASTMNSFSDMGRELGFLLGYAGASLDMDWLAQSGSLSNNELIENLTNSMVASSGDNNLFNSLAKHAQVIATGGKLIFPKLWSDSSFSRSYDVSIKLRSPDNDNLSLYYNIILPMCFLICLTQPRMITNNPNAYASPFLVRGSYKGFFNVDMGIITGLNFSKGDEAQWNAMGIPTTVDVSMTIVDLYETLSITATGSNMLSYDTLDNTALMDYLMTMCGINVYKPEFARMLDMWYITNVKSRASNVFSTSLWGNIRNSISKSIMNIYRR